MTSEALTLHEHDPATAKIARFLTDSLGGNPTPARFGVYHIRAQRVGNLLRSFPSIDSNEDSAMWCKETAASIVAQAHDDADTLGGTIQSYAVIAEGIVG